MVDSKKTMWCRQCQQDVPAIASSLERKFCCPRCGEAVGGQCPTQPDAKTSSSQSPPVHARDEETPSYDCWELDDQLWRIAQVLQVDKDRGPRRAKDYHRKNTRIDSAHKIKASGAVFKRDSATVGNKTVFDAFILLGTAALVCGGILLGWSFWAGRGDLWKIGLPIAAAGQVSLLIGLVLHIDRFWRDQHHTVSKLDEVDEKLHELKKSATLRRAIHGPSSKQFYTHLAGGANTQLLLGDLKSQLDLLAMKIGDQEDG